MYNYSFIIPHKNSPKLLARCLESIPHRKDVEIIVVDDNSDSSIVNFEDFPGMNRADVHIIFSKEGRGAGYARNCAISAAKGKWLVFADADDYFTDRLSFLLDKYMDDVVTDLVFFNAEGVDDNDNKSFVNVQKYIGNYEKGRKYSEKER